MVNQQIGGLGCSSYPAKIKFIKFFHKILFKLSEFEKFTSYLVEVTPRPLKSWKHRYRQRGRWKWQKWQIIIILFQYFTSYDGGTIAKMSSW